MQPSLLDLRPRFDGETFDPALDADRLTRQLDTVRRLMADGVWRTLAEIHAASGVPEASASARLRDLRKARHGAYTVLRRRRDMPTRGIWEYRVLPTEEAA